MFNTLGRRKTAVFALISAAVLYAFQLFPFFVKDPVIGGNVGHRVDDEPPRKSDCYNSKTKDGSIFSFASPSAHSTTVDDAPSTDLFTRLLHPGSPPGFTTLSRLYFYQGTLYAVVKDEESKAAYPHMKFILSQPVEAGPLPSEPTDREMQILTEDEATLIFGPLDQVIFIEGLSLILYDVSQFMHHYYHWWAEIILGAIRAYTSLALVPGMESPLMEPSRIILPNVPDSSWRDHDAVNMRLSRAAFPSTSIENADFWEDLISIERPFVFERSLIVSRIAAHRSPLAPVWHKMIASTMNITVPTQYWEPLRQRLVRNTLGHLPSSNLPLVLYISRQSNNGRRLLHSAHADLVQALKKVEEEGICELKIAKMEELSIQSQIELAARAIIMIGVHGNGLTHQMWMPASSRSTVIEILYPTTYIHDYSIVARSMGHKHYGVWNDETLTFPEGKWFDGINHGTREQLHGPNIPVDGETVARVVRERLAVPP